MSDINITEAITDKNSWFNIKRYKLPGVSSDFSKKTMDVNSLTKETLENELSKSNFIFEKSKKIKDMESVDSIMNEQEDKTIKDFFGYKGWLADKFTILNFTLQFNPYNHIDKFEKMGGFFQYYYEYSKNIIFIPNIRVTKNLYTDGYKMNENPINVISYENYIKFVDEAFDFFSNRNSKPIFVPISIQFSIKQIEDMINYHLKKDRFYFWFDLESKPLAELQTAKIKRANDAISKKERFDKSLTMLTNIKRELISHPKREKSPASDVLGTLYGANIIGVNRDPPKPVKNDSVKKYITHKAREFEKDTYYYKKVDINSILTKEKNVVRNSIKLGEEFDSQFNHFLNKSEIEAYLKTKAMIKEHSGILADIRKTTSKQLSLF